MASCADQRQPQPLWDAVLTEPPDFFVFAGDNVYASEQPFDVATLRGLHGARRQEQLCALTHDCATLGRVGRPRLWRERWRRRVPHKHAAKAFLRFWQLAADDSRRTRDGLYHAQVLTVGTRRVQLIGLDLRWFRSPGCRPISAARPARSAICPMPIRQQCSARRNGAGSRAQLRTPADVRLLVSSIRCGRGPRLGRWGNLPSERDRLYHLIRDTGARGVLILSGDRHIGGIYREANASRIRCTN